MDDNLKLSFGRGVLKLEEVAKRQAAKEARLNADPRRRAAIAAYRRVMKALLGADFDDQTVAAPARTEFAAGSVRTVFASGGTTPWRELKAAGLDLTQAAEPDPDEPNDPIDGNAIWKLFRNRKPKRGGR